MGGMQLQVCNVLEERAGRAGRLRAFCGVASARRRFNSFFVLQIGPAACIVRAVFGWRRWWRWRR